MPSSRANCSAPAPISSTCGLASTARARRIGFLMRSAPATAQQRRLRSYPLRLARTQATVGWNGLTGGVRAGLEEAAGARVKPCLTPDQTAPPAHAEIPPAWHVPCVGSLSAASTYRNAFPGLSARALGRRWPGHCAGRQARQPGGRWRGRGLRQVLQALQRELLCIGHRRDLVLAEEQPVQFWAVDRLHLDQVLGDRDQLVFPCL